MGLPSTGPLIGFGVIGNRFQFRFNAHQVAEFSTPFRDSIGGKIRLSRYADEGIDRTFDGSDFYATQHGGGDHRAVADVSAGRSFDDMLEDVA